MLLELFQARTPPLIGVDISSTAVKMLELADAGKGLYRVERYVIEKLPKEAVSDGNIANLEAVTDTMRLAWRTLGTRIKHVALALPASAVITKKLVLPAGQSELEREAQVQTEAAQVVPFPLEEVNLDFQELGPAANSPNDAEVLLVASRKEKVDDRIAAAQGAGLKVSIMDVESYATVSAYERIAHLLPEGGKNLTVAIFDIGAMALHLTVLDKGQIVYLREQSFGGNQLTHEIQRRYNLSYEESELAKKRGGLPAGYEDEVIAPFADMVATEIGRTLQMLFSSTPFSRVDQILLAGGTAMIPGLEDTVAARTQINTMLGNPFANMAVGAEVKTSQLAQDAPALWVACGLAMRRFDPS